MRASNTRSNERNSSPDVSHPAAVVVLALERIDGEAETLSRAYAASRLLGATLEVLRLVNENVNESSLFADGTLTDSPGDKSLNYEHRRATGAWVRDVLGQRRGVNVTVRVGDLGEEAARLVAALDGADLIVLGGETGRNAELVMRLVRQTKTAVLVGRGATSTEAILAATDLKRKEYPELRSAARLTPQVDGELVAIHNVPPAQFTPEKMWTLGVTPEVVIEACASKLDQASEKIGVPIEAVVCSEAETKVAILGQASERDVDIVVIGLPCDLASDAAAQHALVSEILREAQRSVLVTPLVAIRPAPAA